MTRESEPLLDHPDPLSLPRKPQTFTKDEVTAFRDSTKAFQNPKIPNSEVRNHMSKKEEVLNNPTFQGMMARNRVTRN